MKKYRIELEFISKPFHAETLKRIVRLLRNHFKKEPLK